MAKQIGETAAVKIEMTIIRDVPMVVLRTGYGDYENRVMFPAKQLQEIADIVHSNQLHSAEFAESIS